MMTSAPGDQLPDFQEIAQLLDVVEGRAAGTDPERLDADHQVLLSVQSELVEALERDFPGVDQDDLRLLLDRVEHAVTANRSQRGAVDR
jgi:hypothetical protein